MIATGLSKTHTFQTCKPPGGPLRTSYSTNSEIFDCMELPKTTCAWNEHTEADEDLTDCLRPRAQSMLWDMSVREFYNDVCSGATTVSGSDVLKCSLIIASKKQDSKHMDALCDWMSAPPSKEALRTLDT